MFRDDLIRVVSTSVFGSGGYVVRVYQEIEILLDERRLAELRATGDDNLTSICDDALQALLNVGARADGCLEMDARPPP